MRSLIRSLPRSGAVLVVGLLVLGLPGAARAEGAEPDVEEQARSRFAEGNVAYDVGDFGNALKLFTEAYRLKPLPGFIFNIAQCHRQLGQYSRAAFFYRRYLSLAPDAPTASVVGELVQEMEVRAKEQEARRLERERTAQEQALQRARAEAAQAEAEAAARRRAELEAEQRALEARTAQALTSSAPQPTQTAVSSSWTRKWWVWAGAGVAAAAVTGGVILATGGSGGQDSRTPSLGTVK